MPQSRRSPSTDVVKSVSGNIKAMREKAHRPQPPFMHESVTKGQYRDSYWKKNPQERQAEIQRLGKPELERLLFGEGD